jgi:hypothetical protein
MEIPLHLGVLELDQGPHPERGGLATHLLAVAQEGDDEGSGLGDVLEHLEVAFLENAQREPVAGKTEGLEGENRELAGMHAFLI